MNIAICDDEQQDIDILYNYCKSCKLPYNISTFLSASALLEAFKSQFYDLIFLDIEMDKPNGFEVGSILAGYSPRPVIVFTTNALQYAVRGYGIAFRFLCKPITITMFQSVLREALDEILPQKAAVTCGSTQKMISINDVIYFESLNRHIIFHFANTSEMSSINCKFFSKIFSAYFTTNMHFHMYHICFCTTTPNPPVTAGFFL